ncbi:hypothetical protein TYRP_002314 [Tyrophagus putrescentiae]|nr:hypothetical protein TYRP_002314 [Tyrophagus putrescentiae]
MIPFLIRYDMLVDDQNVDVLELQPPQRGLHRLDDELTGEAAAQVGRGPALPEELTADDVAAAAPGFALQYRAEHHLGGAARKGVPRVEVSPPSPPPTDLIGRRQNGVSHRLVQLTKTLPGGKGEQRHAKAILADVPAKKIKEKRWLNLGKLHHHHLHSPIFHGDGCQAVAAIGVHLAGAEARKGMLQREDGRNGGGAAAAGGSVQALVLVIHSGHTTDQLGQDRGGSTADASDAHARVQVALQVAGGGCLGGNSRSSSRRRPFFSGACSSDALCRRRSQLVLVDHVKLLGIVPIFSSNEFSIQFGSDLFKYVSACSLNRLLLLIDGRTHRVGSGAAAVLQGAASHVGGDVGGDSAHFAIAAAIVLAVFNSSCGGCGFQIMTTATNTVVAGSGGRRVEQRKDVLRVVSLLFERGAIGAGSMGRVLILLVLTVMIVVVVPGTRG